MHIVRLESGRVYSSFELSILVNQFGFRNPEQIAFRAEPVINSESIAAASPLEQFECALPNSFCQRPHFIDDRSGGRFSPINLFDCNL